MNESENFVRKLWPALFLLPILAAGCENRPADVTTTTQVIREGITYNFPVEGVPQVTEQNGTMQILIGTDDIRNESGKLVVDGHTYGHIKAGDIVEWHANKTITINGVPQDSKIISHTAGG